MAKIQINRKDTVPQIVEKMLESDDDDIVLSMPSGSEANSFSDFGLIKREAEAAGKTISISSADKEIIELAGKAGISAAGRQNKKDSPSFLVADIVPLKKGGKGASRKLKIEDVPEPAESKISVKTAGAEKEKPAEKTFWARAEEESGEKKQFAEKIGEPPIHEKHHEKPRRRFRGKRVLVSALVLVLLVGAAGWAVGAFWGRAEVSVSFKKTPWQYKGTVTASKTFSQTDAAKNSVPAEFFSQQKNATRLFPASGTANVSQKATAKILVYNAYSSSKQLLVAATRFAAPDGKVFRLDSAVTVPGAGIKDGKIVPSSIEASVTADKAGADYNIGPLEKMLLPGFKGTPRYDGFYARMPQAASGGFVGQKKVPTDQDISSAREKTAQSLKDSLQNLFLNGGPKGFNIPDGASSVNITRLAVNKTTDSSGNFSVFGEASFQAVGVRDDDVKLLARLLMQKDYPEMDFADFKMDYQNVKADFTAGQLVFTLAASGAIEPKLSEEELKVKIAGKGLNEARGALIKLPDLANAKISLWPFWLTSLPASENKIKVVRN